MDWREAWGNVVTTPPEHRRWVTPANAVSILRCTTSDLHSLIRAGMPSDEDSRVDLYDVLNAGLYSRTHNSQPELELALLRRILHSPTESWVTPMRHRVLAEARCPRSGECSSSGTWSDPEIVGTDWTERERGPGFARWKGEAHARGARTAITADPIKKIWDDVLDGYRFHYAPPGLRSADAARHRNVGDCTSLSMLLAELLLEQGMEARTRQGFLLAGRVASAHQWVEVRDVDNHYKPLDVAMAVLAPGFLTPEYAQFCLGSTMNRLLPAPVDGTISVRHGCDGTTFQVVPQLVRRA